MALRLGTGLGVALSDPHEKANEFQERYCSEVELLSFLGLLESGACLFLGSPLGRRDLSLVHKSGASLVSRHGLPGTTYGVHGMWACIALEWGFGHLQHPEQRALD